ncbi:MAG TPA: RidA family protein [Phycisphaerae bacterium]|nr:RidA family protein [Phycisphaerae bacterium]
MTMIDESLTRLGIVLPPAPRPVAAYVPFVQSGRLVFVSGQLPSVGGKVAVSGLIGEGALGVEEGARGAKLCVINALAVLKDACGGDLDRVVRIVRIGVFVASVNGFTEQSRVANGASELLVELFGEKGKHARAAVGVNALPLGAAVEVELLAEVG